MTWGPRRAWGVGGVTSTPMGRYTFVSRGDSHGSRGPVQPPSPIAIRALDAAITSAFRFSKLLAGVRQLIDEVGSGCINSVSR